jgi:hypothetical protein
MFSDVGMSPVERIPILGRTGPDIVINELKFVIDVKSRLEVPKSILPGPREIFWSKDLIAFRLDDAPMIQKQAEEGGYFIITPCLNCQKSVRGWYDHMDEWTKVHCKEGVTMLVLHKPRLPVGHSAIVIKINDFERIKLCPKPLPQLSFPVQSMALLQP